MGLWTIHTCWEEVNGETFEFLLKNGITGLQKFSREIKKKIYTSSS